MNRDMHRSIEFNETLARIARMNKCIITYTSQPEKCPAFDYANVYSTRASNSFTFALKSLFASFVIRARVNTRSRGTRLCVLCKADSMKRPTSRAYTRGDVAHLGQTRTGAGLHRVARRVTQPCAYAVAVLSKLTGGKKP